MKGFHVVAALICTIFLFSVVLIPFANADWTMFHADPSHSGAGTSNPAVSVNQLTYTLLWSYTTGGISSPAVVDGVVYIGSMGGNVYALNSANSAKLWSYATGGAVWSSPAVVNGVVYIGSMDGNVYALNSANGTKLWSYATGGAVWSSPAVVDGVVYIGSMGGNVYALNATSGDYIWIYSTGGAVESSPTVANGVVYIGSNDKNVYALNSANGIQLWNYTTGGEVYSSPAVVDGVVYIGSNDKNVYALNSANGTKLWNYTTGGEVYSSPAVVNTVVYIGSMGGNVYALNSANGAKLWSYATGGAVWSSPAVVDGVVYIGSDDYNIYAMNATIGVPFWIYSTGGAVESSPAVANGVVYIGSMNGNVYAITYTTQYKVTFSSSGLGGDATGNMVSYSVIGGATSGDASPIGVSGGSIWVDSGATVTYSFVNPVTSSVTGKQYRLGSVTGIGSPITVSGASTVTGNYVAQYKVTFSSSGLGGDATGNMVSYSVIGGATSGDASPIGVSGGSIWVDSGATVTYSFVNPVTSSVTGKQYRLGSVTGIGSPITVSGASTVTGNYVAQYKVTFSSSGLGGDATGNMVSYSVIGGATSGDASPIGVSGGSIWVDSGATVTYSFVNPVTSSVTGKQYRLGSVTGIGSPITVSGASTVTGNYVAQYKVTFVVSPSGSGSTSPAGTNVWEEAGSLGIAATPNVGYTFSHWSSDTGSITFSDANSASTAATINGPGTITGNFFVTGLDHFVFDTVGSQTAGSAFTITVTAVDSSGHTITAFTYTVGLSVNHGSISPTTSGSFVDGVWSDSATLTYAGSGHYQCE